MFEISNQWLMIFIDVSIKSLLLVILAGIAMKVMRIRNSNLRHRIWSGVLSSMLALPALSFWLPALPLTFQNQWTQLSDWSSPAAESAEKSLPVSKDNFATLDGANNGVESASLSPSIQSNVELESGTKADPFLTNPTSDSDTGFASTATDSLERVSSIAFQFGSIVLFLIWLSIASVFSLRLFAGILSAARLRKRSAIVTDEIEKLVQGVAPTTTIRESADTCVPVTVGCFHAAVLLPSEWRSWSLDKLQAIIAHEQTHVVRRDFAVTLFAEWNRCIYWFHPVAWWLRGKLSNLAEEACDDAAIEQTGDRTAYARHLLEVAATVGRTSKRIIQPGLAMARDSNVESRITSILDFKRPLSGRVQRKTAIMLLLFGFPVVAATAAIRPFDSPDNSATKETDRTEVKDPVRVRGQVVDENGTAVSNAKVSVWRVHRPNFYGADNISFKVGELKVDQEGRFDQSFSKNQLPSDDSRRGGKWSVLVVESKGHAVAAMKGAAVSYRINGKKLKTPNFLKEAVTVKLAKAVTIQGKLLSLEGTPIVGANVEIYRVDHPDPDALTKWLERTETQPIQESRSMFTASVPSAKTNYFPSRDVHLPLGAIEAVTSGSDGAFEIPNLIGADDLAVLRVTQPNIAYQFCHVLGRDMNRTFGHGVTIFERSTAYYGNRPVVVTSPSVPVYGIVRDIDTKKPLANAWVAVGSIYGKTMSQSGVIRTKTDSSGRYRIEGLPLVPANRVDPSNRNVLEIHPADASYIESDFEVPIGNGKDAIEFNLELRRAIVAHGKLTNKKTGNPIKDAGVYYAPYNKNVNAANYARYSDREHQMLGNHTRYRTDENGEFQIPVIPGRGVIGARADDGTYVSGFGAKGIEAFERKEDGRMDLFSLSDAIVPSLYQSLLEIDVPASATEYEVAMTADPGIPAVVHFVDPKGDPLFITEFTNDKNRIEKPDDSKIKIDGLEIGSIRSIFARNEKLKLARFSRLVPEKDQSEFTVQLLPYGEMRGRIVDPEGRPISGASLQAQHRNDPDFSGSLPLIQTDDDGRFTYALPVGVKYNFQFRIDNAVRKLAEIDMSDKPKQIDLGVVVFDEYSKNWSYLKSKKEATITDQTP